MLRKYKREAADFLDTCQEILYNEHGGISAETCKKGGIKLGNAKVLSLDAVWHENNGGTLLKIGETFRIDVGSNTLLHMHLRNGSSHIQIGTIGAGIYGWLE